MLEGVLIGTGLAYLYLASFMCLLFAAELAFPKGEMPSWKSRWLAVQFALIFIPVVMLSAKSAALLGREIGLAPLVSLGGSWLGVILGAIVAALIGDFLYYWYHRAQHSIPWLWRIHSVHHSAEHLAAGSGYHHLAEAPLKAILVGIPLGLLVARSGGALFGFILAMHGYYVHSSTRISFGRFAWVVCDNRVHRIHHSKELRHFGKNFGVVTLLWDKLFGTAYWPNGEWPEVGLTEQREPKSVWEYLSLPVPSTLAG